MSPQPRLRLGCGDIWESVVSQPWPQTRYQFLQPNDYMQYITTHIIAIQQVINSLGLGYHVNMGSGPWLNIKMSSYQCKKSHCGDKTILRLSYLHNGIFYTGKMTSLYWISPLVVAWCCQAASKLSLWWPHVALSLNELKELIPSLRSWLWHHRLPNVTTTEAQPRLWWHLGVCGVTAMTENEVSISILSWYHKINFELLVIAKPNCLSAAQV